MTACTCNCLKNKKKVFRGSDSRLSKWSLYVGQMAIILCEVLQQLGYSWSFFYFRNVNDETCIGPYSAQK